MISYNQFKELFNKLELGAEIEINFNNDEQYMIVKKDKTFAFEKNNGGVINEYNSFVETSLKNKWNDINDIIINFAFSVVDDKDKLQEIYDINL